MCPYTVLLFAAGTGEVTSFDILDNRENDITNAVLNKSSTTIQTQTSGSCDTGKCQCALDKEFYVFYCANEQCDSEHNTQFYQQPSYSKRKWYAIRRLTVFAEVRKINQPRFYCVR